MSEELLRLKQEELRLLREKEHELRTNALAYYRPHEKQDLFHAAGDFRLRLVEAGNRFGKSQMGAAEDCAWLLGERMWYPRDDERRTRGLPRRGRPVKGLVICTSWQKVREVYTDDTPGNEGKILKYLPPDLIDSTHKKGDAIYLIQLKNGSSITFSTVEQYKKNPQSVESSDWDFIHVDEPCPEKMFKGCARGLIDRGGKAWFTLTPLEEPWISDMFFPDIEVHNLVEFYEDGRAKRWAISASMHDNPYNDAAAKEDYLASLTEEERECRESGRPFNRVGLVYSEFDPAKHVVSSIPKSFTSPRNPPISWSHYVFIDPHPQTPHAVQFYAVPPGANRVYLYDEIFEKLPPSQLAKEILTRLGDANLIEAYMDPLGFQEDPETEISPADRFHEAGLPVMKATKDLINGIMYAKEKLSIDGYLRILPHCQRTLWEFRRYRWDVDRQTGAPKNKPVDKDDHMMECFYRAMLADMFYADKSASFAIPEETFSTPQYTLQDVSYSL